MAGGQRRQTYRYIEGNTARKLDVRRAMEEEPRKKLSNETRKNRDRAYYMNFGYVIFLAAALCIAAYVLIGFIRLQADLTAQVEQIAASNAASHGPRMVGREARNVAKVAVEAVIRSKFVAMVKPPRGAGPRPPGPPTPRAPRLSPSRT